MPASSLGFELCPRLETIEPRHMPCEAREHLGSEAREHTILESEGREPPEPRIRGGTRIRVGSEARVFAVKSHCAG